MEKFLRSQCSQPSILDISAATSEKLTSDIISQQRFKSASAFMQPDQNLIYFFHKTGLTFYPIKGANLHKMPSCVFWEKYLCMLSAENFTQQAITVITLIIGTKGLCKQCRPRSDAAECSMVYTDCHIYSSILDTPRSSKLTISNFRTSMVKR